MLLLCVLCTVLLIVIAALTIKIRLLQKAADEIHAELGAKLETDTNTLICVSSTDLHIRRLAAALNRQLRLLRRERRRLQSGDWELKEAVTNISHDLRTPLTAVCGYLELLKREETSETVSRYLSIIENRTESLKSLTEELFRYSIITSSQTELVLEPLSLNCCLEESISDYYDLFKDRGILPLISIPEKRVPRKLDREALSRIFGNIINNAVKYCDRDLEIVLTEEGRITFTNTASGLTGIQVGKLFDRFYTVESGESSTGLGLSIARALTEQMHGSIHAIYEDCKLSICVFFPEVFNF